MAGNIWESNLIFLLFVIALLLVIGILAVCLWSLLLVLRQYYAIMQKMNEENKEKRENKEDVAQASALMPVPVQKELNEAESLPEDIGDGKGHDVVHKSDVQEPCKDIRERIMEFIRFTPKNNSIHLNAVDRSIISCLEEYELAEDSAGKLVMIQGKSGECFVVPESENIGEKEYEYCGVKGCYETNIPVRSGCYYQIIQIPELCTVQKHEDKYIIQSKGKLMLEQK